MLLVLAHGLGWMALLAWHGFGRGKPPKLAPLLRLCGVEAVAYAACCERQRAGATPLQRLKARVKALASA